MGRLLPPGRAARNQWANVVAGHAEGVGGDEKERDSRGTLLAFACVLCVWMGKINWQAVNIIVMLLFICFLQFSV